MELETERLRLRHWSERYFDIYAEVYADEEQARYIGGQLDRPRAWRHMAALAGHWALRGYGPWAIEEKETKTFVGSIGLWFPEGWPELEVGYWLVPTTRGKGYATEAGQRSLDYAFGELKATTIVSYIAPDNKPSIRVAERLGGTHDDTIELLDHGRHCVYRYNKPA